MTRAVQVPAPPARTRLSPSDRRAQLIAVSAGLLSTGGVEALQYTEIASAAGVTRPVVYKFFPTREDLVAAILDDFEAELKTRFRTLGKELRDPSIGGATRVFIDAICDTIEAKGAGAWDLLGGYGPDARVAELGRAAQARLMRPWRARIAEATGATKREVETVSAMLVAAGRAVLARWYAGELSRAEAARDATRGVSALLVAFASTRP